MPLTNPGAGTMKPPSPWIGSIDHGGDVLLADVLVDLVAARTRGSLVAQRLGAPPRGSGRGRRTAAGRSRARTGPIPCLYGITFAVSDIAISVRPWNAWSNATTAWRPVALRAIFTAFSTASAPEFANIVFFGRVAGRERVQPFGQLDVGLVRRDVEAGVGVELGLPLHRRDHLGRRVPDVQDRDPGREVDQPVPVDVLDDRP